MTSDLVAQLLPLCIHFKFEPSPCTDPACTACRAADEIERLRGERVGNLDPDFLGQVVRMAWVKWAHEQDSPKPHWLEPWESLSEVDKEADRCIGRAVAEVCVTPALLKVEAENRALREKLEKAKKFLSALVYHYPYWKLRNEAFDFLAELSPLVGELRALDADISKPNEREESSTK
jgi:hypothetical protein